MAGMLMDAWQRSLSDLGVVGPDKAARPAAERERACAAPLATRPVADGDTKKHGAGPTPDTRPPDRRAAPTAGSRSFVSFVDRGVWNRPAQ